MSKASSLGLKEIRISMGLFDFDVLCVVGKQENAAKYVQFKFEEPELNDETLDKGYEARGRCYFRVGYVPILWIPHKPKTPREHGTLAHECLHAVMHLYDWAGMSVSYHNEEMMGHAAAHLVTTILEGLRA